MRLTKFKHAVSRSRLCSISCLGLLFICSVMISQISFAADASDTTIIYLVRHAEKIIAAKDPGLTQYGQSRALELARVLQDEPITAIFASQYRRTADTGRPLAERLGLKLLQYDAGDAEGLKAEILNRYTGQAIVVVGHSNTLDDIAAAFGISGMQDLDESMYDRLFVVHHRPDGSYIQRLRFGDRTP